MTARPTAKKTTRATPKGAPRAEGARGLAKGAHELLAALEERGLLDQAEVARLVKGLDEADADKSATDAVAKLAQFHRKLAGCLNDVNGIPESARGKKLDALFEINRVIALTEDAGECFEKLLGQVRKLIPAEGATLFLADTQTGRLKPAATAGLHIDLIERIDFEGGDGFSGWVARQQKPVLFSSLKRSQPTHGGVIKSFLSVPLVVGRQTIGVLNLGDSQENAFTKDDLRLLILVASQASGVIQKTLMLEEIKELAITDDLTGLYNRRHFMLRMNDEVARANRFVQEFSLIFLDLDEFKRYNDAYGQETGDRALKELGDVLKAVARSTDILARYGGEEFVLLLPTTGREEALIAAERIRIGIEEHVFPRRKRLTVSVGVATFPEDAAEPAELLNRADRALYQAKREGRNRIVAMPLVAAPAR